jgi:dTDP-4-amino-4,6-dideoxygalactose transaminase
MLAAGGRIAAGGGQAIRMSSRHDLPFNRPAIVGNEYKYIEAAVNSRHLSGNGPFTKQCHRWLESQLSCAHALLTHSCTAALEMAALLLDVEPGDEIIMPSFAFVSTANAFVLRRATPVFVDIRADTLNIDETLIEAAITPRTRAIVALHYAGIACEMDTIMAVAARHNLRVVEDAAQGVKASYRHRCLGTIGDFGAVSFHETKNVISGEGGALLVKDERDAARAEIIWEKGTNRTQFVRGEVDKYTWLDVGSSYLPGELVAAFLLAQLEHVDGITAERVRLWQRYHAGFEELERLGVLRRPIVPPHCQHNGHIYHVLLPSAQARQHMLGALRQRGIDAVFHYVPLHSAPAGRRFARTTGAMRVTDDVSSRLIRLPLWIGMSDDHIDSVVAAIHDQAALVPQVHRTKS